MDDKTARKITVLGSDTDIMRNEIGKYVPFAEFPKMYGGDGDNDLKVGAYLKDISIFEKYCVQ